MEREHILLTTIINNFTAIVATNVINLAARLMDSDTCYKPSHPLVAYKFQDMKKNIWDV
jgi:hypothetical protein